MLFAQMPLEAIIFGKHINKLTILKKDKYFFPNVEKASWISDYKVKI